MTKKDYERFANRFRQIADNNERQRAIETLAPVLKADKPRFNLAKFTEACHTGRHIRASIKN